MNSTYGWLYQKYAYPLLEKQREKAREEMKALVPGNGALTRSSS